MTTNEGLRSKARSLLFSLQKETHSSPGLKAPSALAPLWVAKALESSAAENKPVWIMVYYGWISGDTSVDPIYAILRNALMKMPEEYPYRGPKEYKENEYTYTNSWQGELEQFSGEEKITQGKKSILPDNQTNTTMIGRMNS